MISTSNLRVGIAVLAIVLIIGMIVPLGAVAQSQGEDEPNDAQEAATSIEGTSIEGEISQSGGIDWYSKEFTAGETVSFAVTKSIWDNGLKMELHAPNGSEIDQDMGYHGVGTMVVSVPANESGEYYVEIEAVDESYSEIPYTVYTPADDAPPKQRSTEPVAGAQQESEPNDNQSNRVTGEEITGEISTENDTDWYAFQANNDQNISIVLTKSSSDEDVYIRTDVHAPDDSYRTSGVSLSNGDTREQAVIPIEATGMHYLEVSGDKSEYTIQFSGGDLPIQPEGSADGGVEPAQSDNPETEETDASESDASESDDSDMEEGTDTAGSTDQNTRSEPENEDQESSNADTATDEEDVTSLFGPGFTGGGAVVALFVTALFALRRQ